MLRSRHLIKYIGATVVLFCKPRQILLSLRQKIKFGTHALFYYHVELHVWHYSCCCISSKALLSIYIYKERHYVRHNLVTRLNRHLPRNSANCLRKKGKCKALTASVLKPSCDSEWRTEDFIKCPKVAGNQVTWLNIYFTKLQSLWPALTWSHQCDS